MAADEEDTGLTHRLDHFAELHEVTTLIESIGSICHHDILLEASEERFIGRFGHFPDFICLIYLHKLYVFCYCLFSNTK